MLQDIATIKIVQTTDFSSLFLFWLMKQHQKNNFPIFFVSNIDHDNNEIESEFRIEFVNLDNDNFQELIQLFEDFKTTN